MYVAIPSWPFSLYMYSCVKKAENMMLPHLHCFPHLYGLLLGLLGHLFLPGNGRLDANAAKDEADAEPLHLRQAVAKGDDGEDHGEHLARHRHGDEQDGRECRQRVDWERAC